jgi:ABC-type transport system involved in multi-copper enzyme maturation permease subunit
MSNAITQPPGMRSGGDWRTREETAPSVLRTDDPSFARVVGMLGAASIIFGGMALILQATGRVTPLGAGWSSFLLAIGIAGLLFHAAFDWDVQFRRIYMGFGYLLSVFVGPFLTLVPYNGKMGTLFAHGFLCLLLGMLFLLAFLRNETDAWLRKMAQNVLGALGAIMIVVGLAGGNIKGEFLLPVGFLLALLGLVYLACYVGSRGIDDDFSYRTGQILGLVGAVVFLVAFCRSAFPPLFYQWNWTKTPPPEYLVPTGILLMFLGVLYGLTSIGLCSDRPLVVLTRRELGAFFYSPIAYIMLFACIVAESLAYFMVMINMLDRQEPMFEPIFRNFILQWPTVLFAICIVPVSTMRLLSEEKRSGTMEVLLTAPVSETSVVLSKFLGAFLFFLVTWVPFGLLMVALRIEGGKPFDYRPLLSFAVALCITGAGFVSMGLFFSSLSRNQIVSGLLTLISMVFLTMFFLINMLLQGSKGPDTPWATVLTHISYLDIWVATTDGKLVPRLMLFYLSMSVAWLFLTVKVLEARRWT